MKKLRKILAGTLTALSFASGTRASESGTRASEKGKIQNSKVINSKSLNLSNKNKVLNFVKNNKDKFIGITAGAIALGTIYGLGREGIYNGLFPGSRKSLYFRTHNDAQIDYAEQEAIKNGLKHIELKTDFGVLRGFACVPKNMNNEDIKKIVLVFGGNGHLACHAVGSAYYGSAKEDKKNTIFVCLDYPTYGKSEGPTLSQKVMQQYAKYCLDYAKKLKDDKYQNAEISTYGYSLGGYPASYLSKEKEVKEVKLWSPIQWDSAVQGLTNYRWLGLVGRLLAFSLAEFDSIENIKNSHENCKINLFSGSRAAGDFLSLETTVFKGEKYEGQIDKNQSQKYLQDIRNLNHEISEKDHNDVVIIGQGRKDEVESFLNQEKQQKEQLEKIRNEKYEVVKKLEEIVAKEAYKKLSKEGKNNLGGRLTVSFLFTASHFDNGFKDKVWHLESTWDKNKEEVNKQRGGNYEKN